MVVSNSINQMYEQMKSWRQDLHSIPEIGLKEYETSKYIKSKLSEFKIEYKDGYAGTGIVAHIKGANGKSNKSIGLRADFDALPMPEKNNFEHKSKNDGMMHACGHDGHTSMLLGAAKYLSENNDFDGDVYFIFQPGEEGFAGGQKMIEDGMFEDFKIDEVYALHNWPELPIGSIGINSGPMMAAVDEFDIIVKGKGGHAAIPQLAIDPVIIASNVNTNIDPSMGGEDFSYLLEKKPGSYLYIGQGDYNHRAHLHTTNYDFNDNLLPIGVNYWVELVREFFSK